MNHYVYRIDRTQTGEWYVGIRSCRATPAKDYRYMGSGTRVSRIDRSELVKRILVQVQTRNEARRIEAALVGPDQVADDLCLNLIEGGERGSVGYRHSAETCAKRAEMAQENTYALGHRHTPDVCERIRRAMTGRKNALGYRHTDEARARMSAQRKGRPSNRKGSTMSAEQKAKISASLRAHYAEKRKD